jgi:hypothetical protein
MPVGERISVIASFGPPYGIRPVRFRWGDRLIEAREITYAWQTRRGQSRLYHFSVSDGGSLYELSFDNVSLLWRIEEVEVPGGI